MFAHQLVLCWLACLTVASHGTQQPNGGLVASKGQKFGSQDGHLHRQPYHTPCAVQDPTSPIQAELLHSACVASSASGIALLTYTNRAGITLFGPMFVAALRLASRADRHLAIILQESDAMDACQALHSNCVLDDWSTSAGGPPVAQQGYSQFLSRSFRAITWRKVELARDLVNQGMSTLLVDMDVLWFRDPMPVVSMLPQKHDLYMAKEWLYEGSVNVNCGIFLVNATAAGQGLVKRWLSLRPAWDKDDFALMNEQGALNEVLKDKDSGLRWGVLPPTAFASKCYIPFNSKEEGPPLWRISNMAVLGEQFVSLGRQHGWNTSLVMIHAACAPEDLKLAVLSQFWREWHSRVSGTSTM